MLTLRGQVRKLSDVVCPYGLLARLLVLGCVSMDASVDLFCVFWMCLVVLELRSLSA